MDKKKWKSYFWDFFSIFFAVVFAFALSNWHENRNAHKVSTKILEELSNGFVKDIEDIDVNIKGHEVGMDACDYWSDYFNGKFEPVSYPDTMGVMKLKSYYFNFTRDLITLQNESAYTTLKSKGLEFIESDSLRQDIINLYEYDYPILRKLEEEYYEAQFQENYFILVNNEIAPFLKFDEQNELAGISLNNSLSSRDRKILLSYLWKIKTNRHFIKSFYKEVKVKVLDLEERLADELTSM